MKKLEFQGFRPALRLGRRKIKVYVQNDKKPTKVWSNYALSRDIPVPVQRVPKGER